MIEQPRITIFGDSIAVGESDPLHGGWAGHLRQHIRAANPGARVFNFGVAGDDSAALLDRFEPQCLASNPTSIVIAIGINDARYGGDATRPDSLRYSLNMERLIARALGISGELLILGLTRVDERRTMPLTRAPLTNYANDLILAHDGVLQQVCQMRSVPYVPMFDLLSDEDLADGFHPNPAGHRKMFERLLRFI